MGKFDNRVALGALDKNQCVVIEVDLVNAAGEPTYYTFIQGDRYAIGRKEDADLLRRNGFTVDNRMI